ADVGAVLFVPVGHHPAGNGDDVEALPETHARDRHVDHHDLGDALLQQAFAGAVNVVGARITAGPWTAVGGAATVVEDGTARHLRVIEVAGPGQALDVRLRTQPVRHVGHELDTDLPAARLQDPRHVRELPGGQVVGRIPATDPGVL